MVSCVVLNYNGEKFLKICLESLQKLSYKDKEIIVIDNHSTDNSVEEVRRHFPQMKVIANTHNSGYSGGANQAVEVSRGEYVMILNPDIVFEPDYLGPLVARLEADREIGAIIGKLRAYDFESGKLTNLIDSAGLVMHRNRRCVDRGQGEVDKGQYDTSEEVFGVTGACPLYRRAALEDCMVGGECFDSSFFMYKEDVDVSWRIRLLGWKSFYEPRAVAYHGRGTGAVERGGFVGVASHRHELSRFQKHHSYRNERLMRLKNELPSLLARDVLPIMSKEALMTGWMLVREPYLLRSFYELMRAVPDALRKRREIMNKRKVTAQSMKKWFV